MELSYTAKICSMCFCIAALTSTADVDVQVAFDDGAVLQGLSSIHRVDDGGCAGLIARAIAGAAQHAVHSRSRGKERNERT